MITPIGITPIEKAFYEMSKEDANMQEYFFTYYAQKLILMNHFYPHIESQLHGYIDHGPNHVTRILKLYEKILENNIPTLSHEEVIKDASLNFYEFYLLLCATVWHDVGNLLGRNNHNKNIVKIVERLKNHFFVDEDIKNYAFQIAKAHTGEDGVRKEIQLEDIDYKNEEINLRFLGAFLRFTDELEEGEVRVDKQYYKSMEDQIPDDQKIYWETSLCIKRIEPDPKNSVIKMHAKINQSDLFRLFTKNGREVALIDELVFRVDKMNKERIYYMGFARKHIEFREIVLNITLQNTVPKTITFEFNNDQGYSLFWENNPNINPQEKIDGYILQKEVDQ